MKERTLQILQALVEEFVDTATPVASKRLLQSGQFDISSATVRNEFAMLEEVGLITSPHTSAGKVPTEKGYKFFVDELLQDDPETQLIQTLFQKHADSYRLAKSKESIFDVLRLVAHLSGNVAFAVVDDDRTLYLGLGHVLRSPEFIHEPEKAAQVAEILEGRERFIGLLNSLSIPQGEIKIFIGEDDLLEEIHSCAILATRFKSQSSQGVIGILGPMRMKYSTNRALLQHALDFIV